MLSPEGFQRVRFARSIMFIGDRVKSVASENSQSSALDKVKTIILTFSTKLNDLIGSSTTKGLTIRTYSSIEFSSPLLFSEKMRASFLTKE